MTRLRRGGVLLALLGVVFLSASLGGWIDSASAAVPAGVGAVPLSSAGLVLFGGLLLAGSAVLFSMTRKTLGDAATRDRLTGLYRPAYVNELLGHLAARDDRDGRSQITLVQVDIADLGQVRQRHGERAVDKVLGLAGHQVRGQTRDGDLPARDGDSLVVYLQCEAADQAEAFCRRLAMLMSGEQVHFGSDVVKPEVVTRIAVRRPGEPLDALRRRVAESAPRSCE